MASVEAIGEGDNNDLGIFPDMRCHDVTPDTVFSLMATSKTLTIGSCLPTVLAMERLAYSSEVNWLALTGEL